MSPKFHEIDLTVDEESSSFLGRSSIPIKQKKTYSQTSWLENPEELQLHHNHEKFLLLTVLLLFAQCKMHYND
jgi:hypothetical protein